MGEKNILTALHFDSQFVEQNFHIDSRENSFDKSIFSDFVQTSNLCTTRDSIESVQQIPGRTEQILMLNLSVDIAIFSLFIDRENDVVPGDMTQIVLLKISCFSSSFSSQSKENLIVVSSLKSDDENLFEASTKCSFAVRL